MSVHTCVCVCYVCVCACVHGGEPQHGRAEQAQHGTAVLSLLAGSAAGQLLGVATGAEYLLAKTEDTRREYPLEEDHWIAALEWGEARGARIVSASIGSAITATTTASPSVRPHSSGIRTGTRMGRWMAATHLCRSHWRPLMRAEYFLLSLQATVTH